MEPHEIIDHLDLALSSKDFKKGVVKHCTAKLGQKLYYCWAAGILVPDCTKDLLK